MHTERERQKRDEMSAPVPERDRPIRVLCVTLGGTRRAEIERRFAGRLGESGEGSEGAAAEFELQFVDGVPQRDLRSRAGLLRTLRSVGLLSEEGSVLPPDAADEGVGQASGNDLEQRCWLAMRHLNRDRAVLACVLAHLRAMRIAVEEGWDVILEDNTRGAMHLAAQRIRECAENSPEAHLRYYAYGGRAGEIYEWLSNGSDGERVALPWPRQRVEEMQGKEMDVIWGTLCYSISKAGYEEICNWLRRGLPHSLAWSPRRQKKQFARPIDKIMPRCMLRSDLCIRVARFPAFVRAPVRSVIHPKWDAKFLETSETQLRLAGLGWGDLDLSPQDVDVIGQLQVAAEKYQNESATQVESRSSSRFDSKRRFEVSWLLSKHRRSGFNGRRKGIMKLVLLRAVCMAGHPRLGAASPLRMVVKPSLRLILVRIFSYIVGPRRPWASGSLFWKHGITETGELRYAVYSPPARWHAASKDKKLAILYLHGSSSRGASFEKMRVDSLPKLVEECERFPHTVVTPLCPHGTEWCKHDMLRKLKELIDCVCTKYGKVVVTGPSMGGLGSYMCAAKFSDFIAAAVPICGGGKPVFASLVAGRVPMWFWHGVNDRAVSVADTDAIVASIRSILGARGVLDQHNEGGAHGKTLSTKTHCWLNYSRIAECATPWWSTWGEGHDAWTEAYNSPDLWTWLEKIRKDI